MDSRSFACTRCGAQNSCPESFALTYAGRRVTRLCDSCRDLFDVEFPRSTTLGDLLFSKPVPLSAPERDWRALVRAVASGNEDALHTLYDRMHRIVFTLMLRLVNEWDVAEELTGEAFYDVWRRAGTYGAEETSVVGWILNQARSRAIDRLQSRRPIGRPPESWIDCPMDRLPPPTPGLWNRLAQRIAQERRSEMVTMPELADSPDWQEARPGVSYKVLTRDVERARVNLLVRLAAGAAYPPHTHEGLEELHLLDGELWIDSKQVHPGGYYRAYAGSTDQRVWSETGCTCVLLTSTADILR